MAPCARGASHPSRILPVAGAVLLRPGWLRGGHALSGAHHPPWQSHSLTSALWRVRRWVPDSSGGVGAFGRQRVPSGPWRAAGISAGVS